ATDGTTRPTGGDGARGPFAPPWAESCNRLMARSTILMRASSDQLLQVASDDALQCHYRSKCHEQGQACGRELEQFQAPLVAMAVDPRAADCGEHRQARDFGEGANRMEDRAQLVQQPRDARAHGEGREQYH